MGNRYLSMFLYFWENMTIFTLNLDTWVLIDILKLIPFSIVTAQIVKCEIICSFLIQEIQEKEEGKEGEKGEGKRKGEEGQKRQRKGKREEEKGWKKEVKHLGFYRS